MTLRRLHLAGLTDPIFRYEGFSLEVLRKIAARAIR